MIQVMPPALVMALTSVAYFGSALGLALIRSPEPALPQRGPVRIWNEISQGFTLVLREPILYALTSASVLWNAARGVMNVTLILFALELLHLTPAELGMTFAAEGIGMLFGAIIAVSLKQRLGIGGAIIAGAALCALGGPFVAAATAATGLVMMLLGRFLLGLGR